MKIRVNARKLIQEELENHFNEEREPMPPDSDIINEGYYAGADDELNDPIDIDPEMQKHPISGCLYEIGNCTCQGHDDEDLARDMLKQDLEMGRAVNDRMEEYYERFNS